MKCRKCGKEVPSNLTFCPACGIRLVAEPDLEEITSEIAGKVDFFMNEDENNGKNDGIRIENGRMIYDGENDRTITRGGCSDSDSVFDDISRSLNDSDQPDYESGVDISKDGPEEDDLDLSDYEDDEEDYEVPESRSSKKGRRNNSVFIVAIIVAAVLIVGIAICCIFVFRGKNKNTQEESDMVLADTVTFSITEGESYTAPLEITLESSMGYRMYYTLDGTSPTVNSNQYSGSITLDESYVDSTDGTEITLTVSSYTESSIKSAEYEITFILNYAEIEAPEITPSSGSYTTATMITITAESGAKIYYTTDGTTPTEESNLYTGSFDMERGNTVISAIAVKNGVSSAVTMAVYDLDIPSNYTFSEAEEIVINYLIGKGDILNEDGDCEDGGYAEFMDGGLCVIDNDQYIVVLCYFYDAEGSLTDTVVIGVEDQTGTHIELTQTDSGYTK